MEYTRLLKHKMSGADVKAAKDRLVELGYLYASTHDTFGNDTLAAVKSFQKDKGLKVDGIIGPDTWGAVQLISDATEAAQAANAAADLVEGSAAAAEEAVTAAQEAVAAAQEAVETAVAATVEVGTVTTGAPGTNASVVNVGTKYAAILNFTLPRGNPSNVKVGNQDPDSVAPSLSVGDIYIYCPTLPRGKINGQNIYHTL